MLWKNNILQKQMYVEVKSVFQVFFILLYFLFSRVFSLIIKIHCYDKNLRK